MTQTIAPQTFYVGLNDRRTERFESLWPLPNGISYNSYIIADEKCALIDTIGEGFRDRFLEKIAQAIPGRKLDYLIINHIEPDHSGEIADIIRLFPQIRIIGNARTASFLKSLYDISQNVDQVVNGATISLAEGHTLRFLLTPMLHWPETMMCYDEKTRCLFSGDAFGCFGALNGAVIDKDMKTDIYWDEMRRYYAAIISKYAGWVQSAITAINGLPLDCLCPTHGPVWQKELLKAIDLYNIYSGSTSSAGVTIVYGSMYGNTAVIAEDIAQTLADQGVKNIAVFDIDHTDISFILSSIIKYSTVVIGAPAYNSTLYPPVKNLLETIKEKNIALRDFASFGNYMWSAAALNEFSGFAKDMKWNELLPTIRENGRNQQQRQKDCKDLAQAIWARFNETE